MRGLFLGNKSANEDQTCIGKPTLNHAVTYFLSKNCPNIYKKDLTA